MANTDTVFRIIMDSSGAVRSIKELSSANDDLKKNVKDTTETFSKFEKTIIVANQGIDLFGKTVAQIPKLLLDLAQRGDAVNDVAGAFQNLSDKTGILSSKLLGDLRSATQGTVRDFELMRLANDGALAGLDPSKFQLITKAAKVFGDQIGRETPQAIGELSNAIQVGNTRILKQYGIFLDTGKVVEDYAKKNKRLAEEVSETGRVFAIQEEATKQLEAKLKDVEIGANGAGDSFVEIKTSIDNAIDSVASAIDDNEDLAKALHDISEVIASTDWKHFSDEINAYLSTTINFVRSSLNLINEVRTAISGSNADFNRGLEVIGDALSNKFRLTSAKEDADAYIKSQAELSRTLSTSSIPTLDNLLRTTDKVQLSTEKLSSEWVKSEKNNKKVTDTTGHFNRVIKDNSKELQRQKELYEKLNSADGIIGATNKIESLAKEYFDGTIQANEFAKAVGKINTELAKAGVSKTRIDEIGVLGTKRGSESVFGKPKESNKNNGILGSIFGGSLLGGDLGVGGLSEEIKSKGIGTAIGEQIGSNLADGLLSSLETALSGGSFKGVLTNIGETAGASVGQVLGGPIGSAIGKVAVGKLVDSITNIGRNKALSIKGISSIATGGLTSLIPDSVFEGMFGDNAKTRAKKAADRFFSNLFEEESLAVIINGKLSRVNDLVFSGNQEGGLFSTLSSDVQNKFSAIGSGLEESLGLGEIAAVNLSNVLANNLGGDLNNLQLLIQATGKSFEELGNLAFEAFYKGEVSVTELVNQLSALHDVMSRGIPNATGAVGTAFDNVFSAGFNGGRALLDAISDIAFEAQELGVKDFPALQNVLINTFGKGTDQVVAFFQAMKVAGVNSLADLASASQATIAVIGANLEAISKGQQAVFNASSVQTPTTPDFPTFSSPKVGGFSGGGGSRSGGGSASRSKPADKFKDLSLVVANLSNVAVRGVDDAIKDILALDDSAIGKLEQGFFKKFKGDMLEFEAVALSLGHSFKDLEGSIVNSFKKGATSVSEAKTALDKLYDGVEGQGNVKGAFDKILSLGTNGGQFSIEAIKALGIEADQAGIKALTSDERDKLIKERVAQLLAGRNVTTELQRQAEEQAGKEIDAKFSPLKKLEEALVGSGINGMSAKKLVEQLGQLGLDTVDEIKNVSDETAIRLLGNLDTVNIGFEKTNESIRKTQEEINKINASKEVNVRVNITKGTIDPKLKRELEEYGLSPREIIAVIQDAQGKSKNKNGKSVSQG